MENLTYKKIRTGKYNILLQGEVIGFVIKSYALNKWYAYSNDKEVSVDAQNRNNAAYALLGKLNFLCILLPCTKVHSHGIIKE